MIPFVDEHPLRINWAISVGWDMSEAWLEGSEIVAAFISFANMRSTAGGITWSFSEQQ